MPSARPTRPPSFNRKPKACAPAKIVSGRDRVERPVPRLGPPRVPQTDPVLEGRVVHVVAELNQEYGVRGDVPLPRLPVDRQEKVKAIEEEVAGAAGRVTHLQVQQGLLLIIGRCRSVEAISDDRLQGRVQ